MEDINYDQEFDDTSQSPGVNGEDQGRSSRESSSHFVLDQRVGAGSANQSARTGGSNLGQSPQPGSDATTVILDEIKRLGSSVHQIADRVGKLEAEGPTPKKPRATEPHSWADEVGDRESEYLSDDDLVSREAPKSLVLSESNTAMVTSAFSSSLSNGERRRLRSAYPTPEVSATRCPNLTCVQILEGQARGQVRRHGACQNTSVCR